MASEKKGIDELAAAIQEDLQGGTDNKRKYWLLAERAYQLIRNERMRDLSKAKLAADIEGAMQKDEFNLYTFIQGYTHGK